MKTLRAHGFNQRPRFEQVMGYLKRNEPLPLDQPDHLVRHKPLLPGRFCAVQRGPQPSAPAAHASASRGRLPHSRRGHKEAGWRGGTKGTAKPALLRMTWQETPNPAPWPATGRPPSITDRLRSTADGAQAAADLIGAETAGLAAAQAFRSQLPQDAADSCA